MSDPSFQNKLKEILVSFAFRFDETTRKESGYTMPELDEVVKEAAQQITSLFEELLGENEVDITAGLYADKNALKRDELRDEIRKGLKA